jgi:CheY-like chemotaxis protein/HPt (histidine-containing phosphotransfer) domain-containing protein
MVTTPKNRPQSHHIFEQQAQDLLQEIEQSLAALAKERSLKTIYQLVRASHTLKLDAADLNLRLVHKLASGLESLCRSLGQESVTFEPQHWEVLKSTFQYLKILLTSDRWLVSKTRAETELIYEPQIQKLLTHLQAEIDTLPSPLFFLPTSTELGIDLDKFILTEEVPQLLAQWAKILTHSAPNQVFEQLTIQAEICLRFGEVLNLPDFIDIAQVVLTVLLNQPSLAISVGKLALIGLKSAHQEALINGTNAEAIAIESLFTTHNFSETYIEPTLEDSQALDSDSLSFIASKHDEAELPLLGVEELIQDYVTDEQLLPEIDWQVPEISSLSVRESTKKTNLEPENSSLSHSSSSLSEISLNSESSLTTDPYFLDTESLLIWQLGKLILTLPSTQILEICPSNSGYNPYSPSYPTLFTWKNQQISLFHLGQLIKYSHSYSPKSTVTAKISDTVLQPEAAFLIIVKLAQETIAVDLVIDKLISQTYLEIQPFSSVLIPPKYMYGCAFVEGGKLFPVVDVLKLLEMQMQEIVPMRSSSTILVVDDSKTVREILRMTLQEAGYKVLMAEHGEQAIQLCHQHPEIELVICDIEMPKVNGFEFLVSRRQEAKWRKIPVVMLTFCSTDRERNLAMQLGAAAYMTKPYLKEDLLATIKGILATSKAIKV